MKKQSSLLRRGKNRDSTNIRQRVENSLSHVQGRRQSASRKVPGHADLPLINLGFKTHWTTKIENAVKKALPSLKENQRLRIVFSLEIPKPTRQDIAGILRGDYNVTVFSGAATTPKPSLGITARIEHWAALNGVRLHLVGSSILGTFVELIFERSPHGFSKI